MLENFEKEFKDYYDNCNVFRLDNIILYKDSNVALQYNVLTREWDNPEYANLIPKNQPLKLCQRKSYVFRNTDLGCYINTFQSGDLTTNDLSFLFPEYGYLIEQSIQLQIPFILNAFRSNCTDCIKHINSTSLAKATEMSIKQLNIFQNKLLLSKNEIVYYFVRLNKIVSSFKGLDENVFGLLCDLAMNDNVSNRDLDFYYEKIMSKPGNISKKLEKTLEYIKHNFTEYYELRESLKELGNFDEVEYPEFPKPNEIEPKIGAIRVKLENLENEELYKILNAEYFAIKSKIDEFVYTGEKYSIISPGTIDELDIEGNVLHHCVGSYKHNVAKGKEFILFLRKNSDPKTPFYTIDIDTEGYIRQIHTKYNGNISNDPEKDDLIKFLKEWGKIKSNIVNQKSIKLNYGALCAKE